MKNRTYFLILTAFFLTAQQDCAPEDVDGDGWSIDDGDCDDTDPDVNPGADETCNGVDDDCDGDVDEGLPLSLVGYPDADGDGYGVEAEGVGLCGIMKGYTSARGDCADDDATRYPGADDLSGDGTDSDCGGSDTSDPHVGLTSGSYATIQEALDAAGDGVTVWVGQGSYQEFGLSMDGKAIALRSTEGEDATTIDGQDLGTVMYFVDGEGADSVLDGFTIANGEASYNCRSNAFCEYYGGGMFIDSSSPTLEQVTLSGNSATDGGGMYLYNSSPSLRQVTLSGNSATRDGGGILLDYNSSPSLTAVTVSGNSASQNGGGMYLSYASPRLTQVIVSGNSASYGGGMCLHSSSPRLAQVIISGNSADFKGGGMCLYYSQSLTIVNSIIAYNTGDYNIYTYDSYPSFLYSDVYDPDGDNLYGVTLDDTSLTVEPGFLEDPSWDADSGLWIITDFHLALDSPLVDAGDPSACSAEDTTGCDPDGSRPDIGIYGGPDADAWDRDGDGWSDYFWPGTIDDAPSGFDPSDYDADDGDAQVH